MPIPPLLRQTLQIPRHPEGARVSEVMEGVGEDGDAPRIEPTEELNDSEEEVEQEGHEDITFGVMMMVMMVPVTMGMPVTVVMVVAMVVRAHLIVLVLVFVGLH